MATARSHAVLHRPAAEVWAAISDPTAITDWFPGVEKCELDGNTRVVTVAGGMVVREEIVTNDPALRRFQYRLLELPGLESHLATVDVLDSGDSSIVVYSVEVSPDAMGPAMQKSAEGAVQGLQQHLGA